MDFFKICFAFHAFLLIFGITNLKHDTDNENKK